MAAGQPNVIPGVRRTGELVSGSAIEDGSITLADIADPGGMPVVRRGITVPDGGIGDYVTCAWIGSDNFEVEWNSACVGANGIRYWGHSGAGPAVTFNSDGSVDLQQNGLDIAVLAPAGTIDFSGEPHHYRVRANNTSASFWIDGALVSTHTLSVTWETGVYTFGIGAYAPGQANAKWVHFYDFTLRDLDTDSNSLHFALDTLNGSGQYPNTYPGSARGDGTVVGTVLPVLINSGNAGSGVPIPVGPVVVMVSRTTAQTFTANVALTFTAAPVDPYGWWNGATRIQVPIKGVRQFFVTGRIRATALSGADDIRIRLDEISVTTRAETQVTLDTANEWVSFAICFAHSPSVAADYEVVFSELSAGTAVEVDDVYLTLTLYPDLS